MFAEDALLVEKYFNAVVMMPMPQTRAVPIFNSYILEKVEYTYFYCIIKNPVRVIWVYS